MPPLVEVARRDGNDPSNYRSRARSIGFDQGVNEPFQPTVSKLQIQITRNLEVGMTCVGALYARD